PTFSASFRVSALNSGEWIIRFFLLVMVHLISDCTHLTQCPKLLVRITISKILIYTKTTYRATVMRAVVFFWCEFTARTNP
ncbi:hypothetical protein AB4408_09175, partial [Vibrio sp. 10N.261.46.B6]|uniref:hypothetical protein n=1 Tax=Vibrio sp. 10N.261.46.B6 TaxID=3229659 RepID=UPI0035545A0B